MQVRVGLFEFLTVQSTHQLSRRRLLGRRFLPLGSLPVAAAAIFLMAAMVGRRAKDTLGLLDIAPELLFGTALLKGLRVENLESYLERRLDSQQDRLEAWREYPETTDSASVLDYVTYGWADVFVLAGHQGKLLQAPLQRTREVVPDDPRALLTSQAKVAYDENIGLKLPLLFGETGRAFGYFRAEDAVIMAERDLRTALSQWGRAREGGLKIAQGDPPFSHVREVEEAVSREVEYFQSAWPPLYPLGSRSRIATRRDFREWTTRDLGPRILGIYAVHLLNRTYEFLKKLRAGGPLG